MEQENLTDDSRSGRVGGGSYGLEIPQPASVSLLHQIQEVERELTHRRTLFPKLVRAGKLGESKAQRAMRAMEAVLRTLRDLADRQHQRAE